MTSNIILKNNSRQSANKGGHIKSQFLVYDTMMAVTMNRIMSIKLIHNKILIIVHI